MSNMKLYLNYIELNYIKKAKVNYIKPEIKGIPSNNKNKWHQKDQLESY